MSTKKSATLKVLEKASGGALTIGKLLEATRIGEEMTQPKFAKQLGISKSHLNDIEKGRKSVSVERAARFARQLGYSEEQYISLAIQSQIDDAGLLYRVEIERVA